MHLCSKVLARAGIAVALSVSLQAATAIAQAPESNSFKEVQVTPSAFSLADPTPSWVDTVDIAEVDKTQPVVIRLADTQYLVGSTPVVYVRRAVMINDAASLNAVGQMAIPFVPQYHRLQLHAIQVHRGQDVLDRTTSSAIRFLQRETGLEQGVYSGEVTASVLIDDLRVGDTLVYAYSRHGQNPVFGDKFVDTASWDQGYPTALRRVALSFPVARRIAWRLLGDGQSKPMVPVEATREGMRKLVFEERSLPRVEPEPYTPPDHMPYRWLQFSEFSGWDDVGAWANALFQSNAISDDGLREVVERLRKTPAAEDRIVEALQFVQSEIRYFSVSLGESSHRPSQPDAVLKRRYGDCKDKSLMLISLLKELGISSKPVLLQSDRRKGLSKPLPSPQLFDHVIVQVTLEGKTFYLDPTLLDQRGRLNRMGQFHEGKQVLVVGPETRQISTIASANALELIRSEVAETATLPKFGADSQLQVRQVWNGVVAERLRNLHERMPREQIVKSIGNAMESRYPGASLVGEPDIQDDRVNNTVTIKAPYNVPKLAIEREGNWFVRFLPSNARGALVTPASATRAAPLFLPAFPFDASYSFEVKFPDEVRVVTDPRAESVQNKHFTYTATSAFRGNVAKSTIHLRVLADRVEVANLPKYAEDLRAVGNILTGVIVVTKAAIKSPSAKAATKKDFAQMLRDRLQDTIGKTTEAIKSGKLAGGDLADAYCLRSNAYTDLGRVADALAGANESLKLTPNSSGSLHCRAYVYFGSGEFDKSVADYSKAIALGATKPKDFHQRGISRFYAGRLDEAAEDFTRASDEGDKEAQVYSDLWLSWAYQRLGKPLPEAMVKRAAAQPRGDWPRPALAVMTGHLAPHDMLKLLDGKPGDDRRMASSEGYFYLGQHYLAGGDTSKAREFFEKARQLNVIVYTEHIAAGFELQRLGGPVATTEAPKAKSPEAKAPEAKKAVRKPGGKGPEAWTNQIWKQ